MARTFSWKSTGRATWPRWKPLALLELVLAVLIIAFGAAALLPQIRAVIAKTRTVEAVNEARPGMLAIVEHYALTGRALESDLAGGARPTEISATPEYEKHLSAARAFAAVAAASGQAEAKAGARGDDAPNKIRAGVRDGSVVIVGRMPELSRPYAMVFVPAMPEDGAGVAMQWMCGDTPAPAGSALFGKRIASDIPRDLLPQTCRGVAPP
jgi:hypothetical protein